MSDIDLSTFDFGAVQVREILPQKDPFIMVDSLLSFSFETTVTALEVREDNVFFEEGRLSPSGLLENVAQTCAVRTGFINKYILKSPVSPGFITAIKDAEFFRLPLAGEVLETTVEVRGEVMDILMVGASVRSSGQLLMSGVMALSTKVS